jgi:hypothetical protein
MSQHTDRAFGIEQALRKLIDEDRFPLSPGNWRVEWYDDDGGCEVAIFSGPSAKERGLRYADRQYGQFEEIELEPY